jgi:NADPH:quinone reductase-like Zn-dependent oxidoreductase
MRTKAAVVTAFGAAPQYLDFDGPDASGPHALAVDVLAAGLHPRVRSQAAGTHYTSTDALPLVPGIDGVGRDDEGNLRYFVLPDTTLGAMARRTVIDARRSVVLPADADPVALAAAMNPAMSSWVALRRRVPGALPEGGSVLILGATGNAGRIAIEVARRLGAARVVGAGRDGARLAALAAEAGIDVAALDDADRLGALAGDVDVVIDYVWGEPAAAALAAVVTARPDRGKPLTWIQIGSVAGPDAPIPSAALRAARLAIVGSGQGSVPTPDILAEIPALAAEITAGTFAVHARAIPLADVADAWAQAEAGTTERLVLTP